MLYQFPPSRTVNQKFLFLHIHANTWIVRILSFAKMMNLNWYLTVILIYIFLTSGKTEHLFICLLPLLFLLFESPINNFYTVVLPSRLNSPLFLNCFVMLHLSCTVSWISMLSHWFNDLFVYFWIQRMWSYLLWLYDEW